MSFLREILAVCATGLGLFQLYTQGDGTTMTAVIAFYGVLLGAEVQARAAARSGETT